MDRTIMSALLQWKNRKNRKPLVIHGARQVGKTWVLEKFGEQSFAQYAYFSFDNNKRLAEIFEQDYDIARIISALKIESGIDIRPEQTLLIFDEIQEAPKAMTALKYFCEKAPQYPLVAAGSLLGMSLHSGTSFPVGKIELLNMYPLSFTEFLSAIGQKELASVLENNDIPMLKIFHDKLRDLLRKYYYVGGMPEVVQCFIDTDDMNQVRRLQSNLLNFYEADFSKHAPSEQLPRIRMVWNSIPSQLAKENRKFIYGMLRQGARAKEYELAIQWLTDYGLVYKSTRVSKPALPLISYIQPSAFKLYLLDVGLMSAMGKLTPQTILDGNQIFQEFKGALTEQYVAQSLKEKGLDLYYYATNNATGEIDFMAQWKDYCIPLEIKAEENLRAQSLRAFCKKYQPEIAIRSSMSKYREESWMTNVPLYSIAEHITSL